MKQKKKPRSFRFLRNLFLIAASIALWGLYRSQTVYFSAPFDSPSHRSIRVISTANMQNSGLLQSYDAVYSLDFTIYISVEPNPNLIQNQSETICISPEANVRHLSSPIRNYVPLHWASQLEEEVMTRGDITIDHRSLAIPIDPIFSVVIPIFPRELGTWGACAGYSCVYRNCFNVSNLPIGLHTITLNTHSEITGHSYRPSWQILIEQ